MSLRVWLPLTKDLRNQGLDDVIVTNNGAAFNSVGKLGGCYQFNASGYLKETSFNWTNFNTSEFSLCCWYKEPSPVASGNSQMICIGTNSGWNNIRIGLLRCNNSGYPMFSISDGTNNVNYNFMANNFNLDVWNHIVCTYNNGTMKMYLNGILHKTATTTIVPALNSSQHLGIGAASNGAEPLTGYLNDVRIYDHCLSPMEVKELSKGLILHYPLNRGGWGQENLLTSSYRDITTWDRTDQGVWSITHNKESNTIVLVSTASWEHLYKLLPITFETGAQYTLSCQYKVLQNYNRWSSSYSVGLSLNASNPGSGNAQYPTDIIIPFGSIATEYIEDEITFTATTTTYYLDINGGYIADGSQNIGFEIINIKLEKGAKRTPWCPNSSDTLATTMGLNSTTEYDCSGYCNNGIKIGSLTYESNTPKYNVSTHFNGTASTYIQMPTITLDWGHITFAAWCKWDAFNSWSRIFDFGNGVNGADWDICLANYSTTSNPGLGGRTGSGASWPDTQVTEIPLTSGQWIHLVETIEGKTCKLYANGVLKKTITLTNSPTTTTMTLNYLGKSNWANGPFNGNISDFRVYATVFSADDIKSLYQNSAYIDSSGNVYGAVHTEV